MILHCAGSPCTRETTIPVQSVFFLSYQKCPYFNLYFLVIRIHIWCCYASILSLAIGKFSNLHLQAVGCLRNFTNSKCESIYISNTNSVQFMTLFLKLTLFQPSRLPRKLYAIWKIPSISSRRKQWSNLARKGVVCRWVWAGSHPDVQPMMMMIM